MSVFYIQKWDSVAHILNTHKLVHCRVRMRRIFAEAMLTSFQCLLHTVKCILTTFIERQWTKLCLEFYSVCGIRMRNIKW